MGILDGSRNVQDIFTALNENDDVSLDKLRSLYYKILYKQDLVSKNYLMVRRNIFRKIPSYPNLVWLRTHKEATAYNIKRYLNFGIPREESLKIITDLKEACHITDEYFIKKYGEVEGKKRIALKAKLSARTLKNFIAKYGNEDGARRYEAYKAKLNTASLESYIVRYGKEDGEKRHAEYRTNVAYKNSLNYFKEKYGEVEGKKRYQELNFKKTKKSKIDGWIEEFGEEEGTKRWLATNKKKKIDFIKYYKKYGEANFHSLFNHRYMKSKIIKDIIFKSMPAGEAVVLFNKLYPNLIKNKMQSSRTAKNFLLPIKNYLVANHYHNNSYGWDNKKEKVFHFGNKKKFVRFDFLNSDLNLLIEYDSSYIHLNENISKNDAIKDKIAQENKLTLFRYREWDDMTELEFYLKIYDWIKEKEKEKNENKKD